MMWIDPWLLSMLVAIAIMGVAAYRDGRQRERQRCLNFDEVKYQLERAGWPLKPTPAAPTPEAQPQAMATVPCAHCGRSNREGHQCPCRTEAARQCAACRSPAASGYDYCKYCQLQVLETPGLALKTDNHERNVAARSRLGTYEKRSTPKRTRWSDSLAAGHPESFPSNEGED